MAFNQVSGDQNIQVIEATTAFVKSEESGDRANSDYSTSNVGTSTSPNSQTDSSRKSNPSRPVQSCQFCRRRKIRCDKATPRCTQCLKANAECVYPMRKSRSSVSSQSSAAGPQRREEQLLKRIGKLESAIQGLKVRGAHVVASDEAVSTARYDFHHCKTCTLLTGAGNR
jgi:hypothetical protein